MCNVPTIDMTGTGRNIVKLRQNAGFSVKDLQDIFGFATPNAIYKWQKGMAMPTADISAAEVDHQKAALWYVEQGLLKDNGEVFRPNDHTFRPQVIKAWNQLQDALNAAQ